MKFEFVTNQECIIYIDEADTLKGIKLAEHISPVVNGPVLYDTYLEAVTIHVASVEEVFNAGRRYAELNLLEATPTK